MAVNNKQQIAKTLELLGGAKVTGLPDATESSDAYTLNQASNALATKQDNVSGGAGIAIDGVTLKVDLATAGSDYATLNVTDAAFSSLEGEYTRLGYQAHLDYAGTDLDLNFGGDFNGYYKDNGGGVWAVIFRREIDGNAATSDSGSWMAVLVTIDPTTVTATVSSFVPNYQAVDYDTVSGADVVAENTFRSPAPGGYGSNSDAEYATGSTPAGLKFDNNKLALDFAQNTSDASSTKVFPSSVVKTYIDEQVSDAKDLSNHPFNNAVAQIDGNPTNAQSAFEALEAEIDDVESEISSIQTVNSTQDEYLEDHRLVLGISQGEDSLGAFPMPAAAFTGGATTVKPALLALGNSLSGVYTNMGAIIGVARGEGSQYRPVAGAGQNGIVISYAGNDEDLILTAATGGLSADNNIVSNADIAGTYTLLKDGQGVPVHGNIANFIGNGYPGLSEDGWFIGRDTVINQPGGTGMTADLNDYQVFYKLMVDVFGGGNDGWLVVTVTRGGGGVSDDWRIFLVDVDPAGWLSTSHTQVITGANDSARVTLFDTATQTEEELVGGMGEFNTELIQDKATTKEALESLAVQVELNSAGLGQFWTPTDAHSDTHVNIAAPGTDTFGGAQVTAGKRVLLLGQTDSSENGIYVFAGSALAMTRATDANDDSEFTTNKTVQVLASDEPGISGATFAYTGSDNPVVGTDDLTFQLKSQGVVGDNTITEGKLAVAVAQKLNAKTDKVEAVVTIPAAGSVGVAHNLGTRAFVISIFDNAYNDITSSVEIDRTTDNVVTLSSLVEFAGVTVVIVG